MPSAPADQRFDLAGRATLGTSGLDERGRRAVATQLDPFAARAGAAEPDVRLSWAPFARPLALVEQHNAAGDATVTGCDDGTLALRINERWCRLPDIVGGGPLHFEFEPGFPLGPAFRRLVRPALQLALLRRDHVAIHATAVELAGAGIVVAGWSESGKTETALALMERGAAFLTDKWTVVGADGTLTAYPIGVGVRRWVLPYLPRLQAALPARSRAQFAAAATADVTSAPMRRRARGRVGGLLADAAGRAVELADRAALTPTQLRTAYGQQDDPARRVQLACVALLVNVDSHDVRVEPADPVWAAERLARSAAYERRPWFALHERARYAVPGAAGDEHPEAVVERERTLLEPVLAATRVLTVRAAFPADPRRAADAIARALR